MKNPFFIFIAVVILCGAIAIVGVFGVQSSQNSAIAKEQLVESSQSDLNAEYNRRAGLLVNLAEAVKSYDKHEAEVIVQMSKARNISDNGDVQASMYVKAVADRKSVV